MLAFLACADKEATQQPTVSFAKASLSKKPTEQAPATPSTRNTSQQWDGFFFFDMRMGLIIVIHQGKYYNFERKDFRSFYMDFAYDIDSKLNADGFIPIIRQYYLDRKDQLTSKEKVLFDTKPIVKGGKTVGIACRGYDYQRVPNFDTYLELIDGSKEKLIAEIKANSSYQNEAQIEQALLDADFVKKSKMTDVSLRSQPTPFWELVVNIMEAQ